MSGKHTQIKNAKRLLIANGYTITPPPKESEYAKALRTGKRPAIWPPIMMTREDLNHFRTTHWRLK